MSAGIQHHSALVDQLKGEHRLLLQAFGALKQTSDADDAPAFKRALRVAMESEPLRLSEQEINARRSVLWGSCLDPLVALIDNLNEKHKV